MKKLGLLYGVLGASLGAFGAIAVPDLAGVTVVGGSERRITSKPVELTPNRCYAFVFSAKGPAGGTLTAGSGLVNADLPAPGDDWRAYTNIFHAARAKETFHLGEWKMTGTVQGRGFTVIPVTPRYRTFGDVTLGHGEGIDGNSYAFATSFGGVCRNQARPLASTSSGFNTSRWCIGRNGTVVYRHELPGRTWTHARISTTCGYFAGGSAAVEASKDGTNWMLVYTITNSSAPTAEVPAALLPAKTLWVRFRGSEKCNLQIYDYALDATFAGAPLTAFGGTDYVEDGTGVVIAQIKAPSFFDEGYGARLPVGTGLFDVWTASSGWKIPRRRGLPSETASCVALRTAANEAEAVQLVVRPKRDCADVRVTAELSDARGWKVDVLRVGYVQIERPTDSAGCRALWPDPLPPQEGALALRAGVNQPFWIRVKPPKGTPAGVYRGTLNVSVVPSHQSNNPNNPAIEQCAVPFSVEVFGFNLPDRMTCETAFGFNAGMAHRYHGVKTPEQKRLVTDRYLQALSDHHLSPYDPAQGVRWTVKWKGLKENPLTATPEFDWTAWDAAMEKAFSVYHFTGFRLGLEGLGGGDWESRREPVYQGFKGGTPEYEALMSKYLGGVERHLREKGWLDKAYVYWYDEPEPRDYDFVMNGFATLKRHAPGLRRMLTEEPQKELLGGPNTWCPLTPHLRAPGEKAARAQGDVFWWYVCCGPKAPYVTEFIDHPGAEMRLWLWQTWGEDVQGVLIWATTWWTSSNAYPDGRNPQNPYEDAMSWMQAGSIGKGAKTPWGNGDGRFLYPPVAAADAHPARPVLDEPVVSYRLELLRDGIEDYEYFALLKRLLAQKGARLSAAERARYAALLQVPKSVYRSMTEFATDPAAMESHRILLARAIESLSRK